MHDEERNAQAGFTVIELMVVVGILAILIGIMLPTFLGAKTPAQDRQAQTMLRNSLTAAKAVETANGAGPTQATLSTEEPAIVFLASSASAPANRRSVSVSNGFSVGNQWFLILASHSTSGRCFAILEQSLNPTQFQRVDNATTCQADQFTPTTGWLTSWP
jgi:prepilin-type N-terminal cleavage/methylation domain-containing protein